jgi:SOS regulatory protein LexA
MFPSCNRCCVSQDGKALTVGSQQKRQLKADPAEVWGRIKETLRLETAPEIARRLGITKQSVYEWQRKLPGLDNLLTIAESGNTSLHWLLTGQGPKFIHSNQLPKGEASIFFGEAEHEIIQGLANQEGRDFDEQVRELVLENLIGRGLVRDQAEGVELTFFGREVPKLKPMRLWGEIAAGRPIDVCEEFETVLVPEEFFVHGRENYALRVRGDSMEEEGIFEGDIIICYEAPVADNGDTVVALVDDTQATVKKFYREGKKVRLQPRSAKHEPLILSAERVKIQGIVTGIYRRTI